MDWNNVSFSLSDKFVSQFEGKQPKWGPLGYFTFKRTYARPLEGGQSEEFWQTCRRVVEGVFLIQALHCNQFKLPWNPRKAQRSAQEMFQRMWDFKFLPPGRGLWAAGAPYLFERGTSVPLYNCAYRSTENIDVDFSDPFVWVMDMSMLGVGCGFGTEGRHKNLFLRQPRMSNEPYIVEDSREGWCNLFKRVLDSYVGRDTLPVTVDYTQIRPVGAPIKTFGGAAPGPVPLMKLIERTTKELDQYVTADRPVDSTLIVDLMNFVGEAVVSGNIRRSAEIAFSDPDDKEFINLKNYRDYGSDIGDKPRWASNNSIWAKIGMDYSVVAPLISQNGEPGVVWMENVHQYGRTADPMDIRDYRARGFQPCVEIPLEDAELCNINETFPVFHENLKDYLETLKYAYMYVKTVTLLPTHSEKTNQVQLRNRRVGVSMSGIVQSIDKIGFREHMRWCDSAYQRIKELDRIYSEWLCIPQSIRLTAVKPSGTVSLLCGATPGIHFPHSEYYIRRIRVSKSSSLVKAMTKAGYHVEDCVNQPENTVVISFPVHEPNFSRRKADVSMFEQLELAAQHQAHWADNSVSITVTFKPEEAKDIKKVLELYETRLKAVSFLPLSDHGYQQAPYEEITKEQYEAMKAKLKKPNLNFEIAKENEFCDAEGGLCQLPQREIS